MTPFVDKFYIQDEHCFTELMTREEFEKQKYYTGEERVVYITTDSDNILTIEIKKGEK